MATTCMPCRECWGVSPLGQLTAVTTCCVMLCFHVVAVSWTTARLLPAMSHAEALVGRQYKGLLRDTIGTAHAYGPYVRSLQVVLCSQ